MSTFNLTPNWWVSWSILLGFVRLYVADVSAARFSRSVSIPWTWTCAVCRRCHLAAQQSEANTCLCFYELGDFYGNHQVLLCAVSHVTSDTAVQQSPTFLAKLHHCVLQSLAYHWRKLCVPQARCSPALCQRLSVWYWMQIMGLEARLEIFRVEKSNKNNVAVTDPNVKQTAAVLPSVSHWRCVTCTVLHQRWTSTLLPCAFVPMGESLSRKRVFLLPEHPQWYSGTDAMFDPRRQNVCTGAVSIRKVSLDVKVTVNVNLNVDPNGGASTNWRRSRTPDVKLHDVNNVDARRWRERE